jgi:hypothetical protein
MRDKADKKIFDTIMNKTSIGNIVKFIGGSGRYSTMSILENDMCNSEALELGPAIIYRSHPNAYKDEYEGQRVLIKEIFDGGFLGLNYICDYIGDKRYDGEYVNNKIFSNFHLTQDVSEFPELEVHHMIFSTEKEVKDILRIIPDNYDSAYYSMNDEFHLKWWPKLFGKETPGGFTCGSYVKVVKEIEVYDKYDKLTTILPETIGKIIRLDSISYKDGIVIQLPESDSGLLKSKNPYNRKKRQKYGIRSGLYDLPNSYYTKDPEYFEEIDNVLDYIPLRLKGIKPGILMRVIDEGNENLYGYLYNSNTDAQNFVYDNSGILVEILDVDYLNLEATVKYENILHGVKVSTTKKEVPFKCLRFLRKDEKDLLIKNEEDDINE